MSMRVLDGVRVLDFTRIMSGPHATAILADHGADVIKFESIASGDPSRVIGVDFIEGESALFLMWNRGKRSVVLDLHEPEAIDVVLRLAETADVVIENYRPGVADSIGIGYDQLSAVNPRLVYCSISAFGSSGPLSALPGTDPVVQAASGIMSVTGEAEGDPVMVGVPVADFTASMLAVQGILLALMARERTGRGQRVDISMLFGMLTMLSTRLASYWTTGQNPGPTGSAHSVLVPYQVFRTADGNVMAGAWRDSSWVGFCEAMGLPELADDERFVTNVDRQANQPALIALLQEAFARRTTDEWERRFAGAGALFARVNTFSDILDHPHVTEAGFVSTVEHPTLGSIPQLAPPVQLSDTAASIGVPPPLLGEHTRAVLAEAGYDPAAVAALLEKGIAADLDSLHEMSSELTA